MFVCPVCEEKYFSTEEAMCKHYLSCWKQHNPCHQSTSASQVNFTFSEVNEDVMNFFKSFQKENNNG